MSLLVTTSGNGFAILVSEDEATGSTKLWPGRPESICRAEIAASLDLMRDDLEAERWYPARTTERQWIDGQWCDRRGWVWLSWRRGAERTDWIDPAPAPYLEVNARPWPRKPAPTTAADRMGRAA